MRTTPVAHLQSRIGSYHEAWQAAGHAGRGEISLVLPVYVADTAQAAREEPRASMLHFLRSIGEMLATGTTRRKEDGEKLLRMPYDDVLKELAVYGTPEDVAERLLALRETLGFSRLAVWMNSGGQVSHERVMRSLRLFAERVMPRLS